VRGVRFTPTFKFHAKLSLPNPPKSIGIILYLILCRHR
jgi:hypothetical protein